MDPSLTGFYMMGQKLSDVILVLRITPIEQLSRLPFLFFSASSSAIAYVRHRTAHILALSHPGLVKGFPLGGPKSSKKSNFWPFRKFTSPYLCNRYAAYGKMFYPSPIQLSHVYGPIAHGVLQGGPKSKWRNTSFGDYEPSTVSVFLSVVKCGRLCKAQTYAHSGIEPSRLAKVFLHSVPKKIEKIEFSSICRPYVSQQRLKIEAYKQCTYLFNCPCTPVETPWNLCWWKSYVECEWRVCVSSTDALVLSYFTRPLARVLDAILPRL